MPVKTRAARDRHSHNQCMKPCTISGQLPGPVTPAIVAVVSASMAKEGLGRWTSQMSDWIDHMLKFGCRCGQEGVHCCPRTVTEGQFDYEVHPVSQEFVFKQLAAMPLLQPVVISCQVAIGAEDKVAIVREDKCVQTESEQMEQGIQVEVEEEEVAVAITSLQGEALQLREGQVPGAVIAKMKETSKERRLRRLESKKRKNQVCEDPESPLKPFPPRSGTCGL